MFARVTAEMPGMLYETVKESKRVSTYNNTQGEVTSQSLWSQYDSHFVGITRHNAFS